MRLTDSGNKMVVNGRWRLEWSIWSPNFPVLRSSGISVMQIDGYAKIDIASIGVGDSPEVEFSICVERNPGGLFDRLRSLKIRAMWFFKHNAKSLKIKNRDERFRSNLAKYIETRPIKMGNIINYVELLPKENLRLLDAPYWAFANVYLKDVVVISAISK